MPFKCQVKPAKTTPVKITAKNPVRIPVAADPSTNVQNSSSEPSQLSNNRPLFSNEKEDPSVDVENINREVSFFSSEENDDIENAAEELSPAHLKVKR